MDALFNRTQLLLGKDSMDRIRTVRVIIFGVGGVGSWCAEGLVRSGISRLTIVDSDCVCDTNVNRQLMATTQTIGQPKVEVLRERLLTINPNAEITALQRSYSAETSASFCLEQYDFIIDCIDSLKDKIHLIVTASAVPQPTRFFSSMGAALKLDTTQISVAEYWSVRGCPLGKMLRKRMRQNGLVTARPFLCVYSQELRTNLGAGSIPEEECQGKAQINGSLVHVTASFGFTLSGLVLRSIVEPEVIDDICKTQ